LREAWALLVPSKYSVNQSFRYTVCADIANGMSYLHRHNLIHGNLSIDKCHVDSRWTVKIVDWEYMALYGVLRRNGRNQAQATRENIVIISVVVVFENSKATREKNFLHFLRSEGSQKFPHLAPEIQKDGYLFEPTRAGDVYSFGVIIRDVFVNLPEQELHQTSTDSGYRMPVKAHQIMEIACCEAAVKRPNFEQLEKCLRSATRPTTSGKTSVLDRCVISICRR